MADASWTWMVYMAAHNDVAFAGEESITRMAQARPGAGVRVLVQQSTPDTTVRRDIGADPQQVADLGQVDSGDPATLLDFIRWAAATAPAQRYALVLWSHGSGWAPSEIARLAQQQPPAPVPVTQAELTQRGAGDEGRQVFFSSSMRRLIARPTPGERAIAFDDGSGHSLDTIELGQVAAQAAQILGRPLDLLGMNACQMGCIEVAYQMRGAARVYVASQEDMPVESWPYDDILKRLAAQPDIDAAALGRLVVECYGAYYRANPIAWGQGGVPGGFTLTALSVEPAERLAVAVKALAAALNGDIEGQYRAIRAAHMTARPFKFRLYDLAGFCRALAAHTDAAPGTASAARDVLAALADPALLLAEAHSAPAYDGIGGLSTYLLSQEPGKAPSPYYAETAYAQDTGWGKFLTAYYNATL